MKQIILLLCLVLTLQSGFAQTSYYKGEWTMVNKHALFTSLLKIDIGRDGSAKAEFIWTYLAIDSTNQELVELYKGKKGKSGIEYAEGFFSKATNDFYFTGKSLDDPHVILGNDIYHLKLSENQQAVYGTTESNGSNEGLFYGIKINNTAGEKEFIAASAGIKK